MTLKKKRTEKKYTAASIIIAISIEEVKGRATATGGKKLKLKEGTSIFFYEDLFD